MPRTTVPLVDRFWPRVQRGDGCWLWTGTRNALGYGLIGAGGRNGRNLKVHRLSWELANGPIPAGLEIRHLCGNPSCVRPDHLQPGTHAENQDDIARNRNHGRRKLSAQEVQDIRAAWPEVGSTTLGRRYGVTKRTIMQIVHSVNYRYD